MVRVAASIVFIVVGGLISFANIAALVGLLVERDSERGVSFVPFVGPILASAGIALLLLRPSWWIALPWALDLTAYVSLVGLGGIVLRGRKPRPNTPPKDDGG